MPLIKYRTNEDEVKEIMVDNNITVSDFMDLINKKSTEKVTKSIFRGKILNGDDLIRNHITSSDHVLNLLTVTKGEPKDVMDLEQNLKENEKKKEVKDTVSSSLLRRNDDKRARRGFRYTFTIYTTATSDSMLKGNKIDFSLNDCYYTIYDGIENLVSKFPQIKYEFNLHIFLPGGVYFRSGILNDYYINPDNIAFDNIYVIVTKKSEHPYKIDDTIEDPWFCSTPERKEILSPLCKSSSAGITQIASFLGYMYHGGLNGEQILLSLAKVTRFAPLVVNLFRLIENRPLNVLNILAITAPLFTFFRSIAPTRIKNEHIFEYTLNFLSVFEFFPNTEYLKFLEIDTENEKDCEEMKQFANYCIETEQQQHVIVWTADTINPDFESAFMNPSFSIIENIFSTVTTFKPVAPLSLHYIFYPTFVSGKDDKSCMLFIKEVQDKENCVSIIDPLDKKVKEIDIEELAKEVNCNKKEDVFTLIDPNQVDQIIFICFDESNSMKWKLEGGNPHRGELTRAAIASEFLKALVKKSYALRVSSFYGLISFGSEVKILQPLTAMSSQFIQSLKEINPKGKTLLYDAIDKAQQQICSLIKSKDGKNRYPNSRLRIIVITDGADNKSEKPPETLINDLIKNEIVVDTVLVSLVEKSAGCCTISRLTGGLCFMPKNFEDGIQIFEQEAFLNIKMRHMNPLPYNEITPEIFESEKAKNDKNNYDSYSPNQMIINANSEVSLATPMFMSYMSMKKRINSYRIMRTFIELNIIAKNPNDSYIVHSLYATPEEWRIFIKGPKSTPFSDKWLNLYMIIPPNYPTEPPKFRFLTIPYHPNISSEGTVIFSLNDRNYRASLGIDSIITGIIELLKNPDKNYNINSNAMELFTKNKKEFDKRQKEGETGSKDYKEFLKNVKIYNEIPKDVVVPDEERGKSNLISITKDAVNKAALEGGKIDDHCLLDINDYEIVEKLGSGQFGVVYLVIDKLTKFEFAAKVPRDSGDSEDEIIDYIKEVNVISVFNHAAIAKVYGYCLKDFNGNDKRVIIMENVPNDDLQKIIKDERNGHIKDGWDLTQKLINLYGIASGMAYSVSYGITHSDLKPENILMTNDLRPKISDFDSARLEAEGNQQSFNMSGNDICSPLYTAPEVIQANDDYLKHSEKSDVYSFAMIAYEMITKEVPFRHYGQYKLYNAVCKGERPKIKSEVAVQYRNLITNCWRQKPQERPTFKEITELLNTDKFLNDEEIDRKRFEEYVNYVANYKDSHTKSQFIRPKSEYDKKKGQKDDDDDEVLKHSDAINILDLKEFVKQELIGKGRFSEVVRIKQKSTKEIFAAKISLQKVSKEISKNILSEVNIMKSLNHPAILKFIGYSSFDFEKNPKPTIVTEFASNGSLQNIIDNVSKFPKWNETKKLITIYGIVAGMSYLHDHKILHNDLKPSNVLLDDDFHPKIADFGLSQTIASGDDNDSSSKSISIKGTPSYIAPEVWNEQIYEPFSDVYSFGILLYELVFMKKAFVGLKPVQIGYKVTNNERPPFPLLKKNPFKSLIQRCWAQDPSKRPSFKQLMVELENDKYMTKGVDKNEYKKYIHFIQNYK